MKINFDLDYDDKENKTHLQDNANKVYSTMSTVSHEYKHVNWSNIYPTRCNVTQFILSGTTRNM